MIRVGVERSGSRDLEWDHVGGCGAVPADYMPGQKFKSGTSCAGTGTTNGQLVRSCQLCPESPTYWARPDRVEVPPGPEPVIADRVPGRTPGELDWSDRKLHFEGTGKGDNIKPVDKPCRHCGGMTALRDDAYRPSHKTCAEKAAQP